MTSIYVLIVVAISGVDANRTVSIDVETLTTAKKCERLAESTEELINKEKKYTSVKTYCEKREIR
jgi:hypothetical protein